MSRFYDVLTRASRASEAKDADAILQDVLADVSSHNGALLSLAVDEEPTLTEDSNCVSVAASVNPVVLQSAGLEPSREQTRFTARQVRTVLDKTARLLPNSNDAAIIEHYRKLRTKLVQEQAAAPFTSLMVTSPNPQDGKSVTAFNIALSFAMIPDYRVVLVDVDLRRSTLSKWLGIGDEQPGFCELLDGKAGVNEVVFCNGELPLHFVVSGRSDNPPAELLHSERLRYGIGKLAQCCDLVIIDSPPVNVITDAQLIAGGCDAVLLVARVFSTTYKQLEKAAQDLQQFRVVGTVLNGGARVSRYGSYNAYY